MQFVGQPRVKSNTFFFQFFRHFFLLLHTHTRKLNSKIRFENFDKFNDLNSFSVIGRKRRERIQNEAERASESKAAAANFVVRAPKLNWLQTQPARFTQAAACCGCCCCCCTHTSRTRFVVTRGDEPAAALFDIEHVWERTGFAVRFIFHFVAQTCLSNESNARTGFVCIERFIA